MRKFILISSGILFVLIAAGLVIIGSGEKDNIFIIMSGMAIPFLFTAYWNFYSVYFESRSGYNKEYFTFKDGAGAGIGVFYNKVTVVPFFLTLFGSVAIAIVSAFLGINHSTEEFSIALVCLSFVYSLSLTLYYTIKIGRGLNQNNDLKPGITSDETGFRIAFFFASVATLGLFPLIYFLIRSISKRNGRKV